MAVSPIATRTPRTWTRHVFALESDNGVFRPYGIAVVATDSAVAMLQAHRAAALPDRRRLGGARRERGRRRAADERGVPVAGLHVDDTRYFWYHHTNADTPDKLDPARRRPLRRDDGGVCVCAWRRWRRRCRERSEVVSWELRECGYETASGSNCLPRPCRSRSPPHPLTTAPPFSTPPSHPAPHRTSRPARRSRGCRTRRS